MVFRCFAEKRPAHDVAGKGLERELRELLGLKGLTGVRTLRRYDVEGIDADTYQRARTIVFSEPQVDEVYDEDLPTSQGPWAIFAVEALPGQFDQCSDSAAQCLQMLAGGERPTVRSATVYILLGQVSDEELGKVKKYLINPVESREASLDKPGTLAQQYPEAKPVALVEGFADMDASALEVLRGGMGLAMDLEDLKFLQTYFRDDERRDPTVTEVRVVDTYWSDHCRHTTFSTHLEEVEIDDLVVRSAYEDYLAAREEVYGEKAKTRPETLMDMATIATKVLKKRGLLPELDESEEINACSIHVPAVVDGEAQDWLLMFKNETHNHPTEIEPFGGAATCIGGCIRDPLSGRVYVHQAMRVTGCGDPRTPLSETLEGKLPQRKLCQTAAAGYSSYGNQIGLATGQVSELYHPGYVAKHLECGAVVGAAPASHVRRERPAPGDVVILLGGRTGRDGIGGATGSSKSHDLKSLDTMASEVQKGNAPEERKIQRLFRDGNVTRLIKRCNDFGAGGVSVAIGELADGLAIDLDAVRKKYDGLDGTELAISESQERMAVVVARSDADKFIAAAERENLEAYVVAEVTEEPRMVMKWRGEVIANLSRDFLNTNGAVKTAKVYVPDAPGKKENRSFECERIDDETICATYCGPTLREMAGSLKCASQRGLVERFDGSIGAGSVLIPFGGKHQTTPAQAMAALLPVEPGQETAQASVMAWGCDPDTLSRDPYWGAYEAVTTSLAKLVAAGADYKKAYLTLQEFFEKLRDEPGRWGKPFAALLGAMEAQLQYGCAAIGGKDSMSGSFLDLDVPPTLISFAIAPIQAGEVISPEFKEPGHPVYYFGASPLHRKEAWETFHALAREGKIKAAWAVESGIDEAVMKMSFGNKIGFSGDDVLLRGYRHSGDIVAELTEEIDCECAQKIGKTTEAAVISIDGDEAPIDELLALNEGVLEDVYPTRAAVEGKAETYSCTERAPIVAKHKIARPKAVIPVFPGTNCELDTAAACLKADIDPEILVIRNGSAAALAESVNALAAAIGKAQIIALPGGFSGGDEPDGSAKFICSLFRNAAVTDAVHDLLKRRDGLMVGICNGFQALIKLGLIQYGEIRPTDETCPTLTFNAIGRHQSKYVYTRVASVRSPWLSLCNVGDVHAIPISHGEGRFVCTPEVLKTLAARGQIATQYVDAEGRVSMDISANPNGSVGAVEGLFSPDGRCLARWATPSARVPM